MNRIFKAVWNESSGTWVAASETSKSKTKRSSSVGKLALAQAAMIGGLLAGSSAYAQVSDDWSHPVGAVMATGTNSYAPPSDTDAFGLADGNQATAIGVQASAGGDSSIALGYQASTSATGATAVGSYARQMARMVQRSARRPRRKA